MPLWRAAVLCAPLARRPEYETCRALNPNWMWLDPMFNLVALAYGVKPPRSSARVEDTPTVGTGSAVGIDQLRHALTMRRTVVA